MYQCLRDELVAKLGQRKKITLRLINTLSKLRPEFPEYPGTEAFFLVTKGQRFLLGYFRRTEDWKKGEISDDNRRDLKLLYDTLLEILETVHLELKIRYRLHDPGQQLARLGLEGFIEEAPDGQIKWLQDQLRTNKNLIVHDFQTDRRIRELKSFLDN